ncbi:hypothetical protein [Terrabacter terrigena]|uniref:Uncharacterized protein n=1 Tax=Terrabacter terrigena TaxID=574718 RepID=A0ABW3MWR4_9MICO
MPTPNPSPRGDEGIRRDLAAIRKDIEQLRRQRDKSETAALLVQIGPEENLSWQVGTPWLDTSGE